MKDLQRLLTALSYLFFYVITSTISTASALLLSKAL